MSNNTIRVGIVGAGRSVRGTHIRDFRAIEGVEVVSVANRSRESSQRAANALQIPTVYDTWVDLIAAPDTDAIFIGTWPYMHRTMVIAALEHGKHVLTQARMANNAQEAREMLDASRKAPNLVAQIVPTKGTFKVDATVIELLDKGYVGDLLSVDITEGEGFLDRDAPYTFRHDRDLSGYNAMSIGMLAEGMMRWLGPASSVTAITRLHVPTRTDKAGRSHFVTVPDHAEILCEMVSGPVVHIRVSQVVGLGPNGFWMFGSEGTLHFDADSQRLYGARKGDAGLSEIEIPPEKQTNRVLVEGFINAIRGDHSVTNTSFEDGVRYMEFTEAVTRSAQSRVTIFLPL